MEEVDEEEALAEPEEEKENGAKEGDVSLDLTSPGKAADSSSAPNVVKISGQSAEEVN